MDDEIVSIIHSNDLHSHFENWPKIQRRFNKDNGHTTLKFDIGDFQDRIHPLVESSKGKISVDLMNEVDYDAVTIGNNEGLGNDLEVLKHLYDHANFTPLVANLYDKESKQRFFKPYKIIETSQGTKIAVIGLTAQFKDTYSANGWLISDPLDELRKILPEVKAKSDFIILLSHLGINYDRKIGLANLGVNLILGAHTHHLLPKGEWVNETLLAAAGKYGQNIGEVTLKFRNHDVYDLLAETHEVAELPEVTGDEPMVTELTARGIKELGQIKLAKISQPLRVADGSLNRLVLEAVADKAGVKASIINSGLLLQDIKQGVVTKADILTALPHPMHVVKLTLKGWQLKDILHELDTIQPELENYQFDGFGFRGDHFGKLSFLNLSYDSQTNNAFYDGEPVVNEDNYFVAVPDHYLFVPFITSIRKYGLPNVEYLFPLFLRDVVGNYLKENKTWKIK